MERYAYLQTMPNSPLTPLTPLSENTSFDFNFGGDGSLDVYIDDVRHKHRVEQQQQLITALKKQHQKYTRTPDKQQQQRKDSPARPRQRYSERFRKIRDIFENQQTKDFEVPFTRMHLKDAPKKLHCCHQQKDCRHPTQKQPQQHQVPPLSVHNHQARPIIKIVQAEDTPQSLPQDYVATPTNVRTPLKQRNHNVILTLPQKMNPQQQQEHHQRLKLLQQKSAFLQPNRRPANATAATQQSHSQHHHHFRQASPVTLKPLCPNISKILHQRGLSLYCGVFQREEIDLFSFKMLTLFDLNAMGITNTKHCDIIMAEVCYARQYY